MYTSNANMLSWNTGYNDFSDVMWWAFICPQNFEYCPNYTLSHCSHCIWRVNCSWSLVHSYCREILRPATMQPNQTQHRSKQVLWTNIWNKVGFFKTTNKAFFHCRYLTNMTLGCVVSFGLHVVNVWINGSVHLWSDHSGQMSYQVWRGPQSCFFIG